MLVWHFSIGGPTVGGGGGGMGVTFGPRDVALAGTYFDHRVLRGPGPWTLGADPILRVPAPAPGSVPWAWVAGRPQEDVFVRVVRATQDNSDRIAALGDLYRDLLHDPAPAVPLDVVQQAWKDIYDQRLPGTGWLDRLQALLGTATSHRARTWRGRLRELGARSVDLVANVGRRLGLGRVDARALARPDVAPAPARRRPAHRGPPRSFPMPRTRVPAHPAAGSRDLDRPTRARRAVGDFSGGSSCCPGARTSGLIQLGSGPHEDSQCNRCGAITGLGETSETSGTASTSPAKVTTCEALS